MFKPAAWIPVLSLLFLCAPASHGAQKVTSTPAVNKAVDSTAIRPVPVANERIVVYYFRNNKRCPSCFKIENFSKAAVEEGFASEVKSGRMEWKMINIQDPGNEFYIDKYQIYTKTVIVSSQKAGKETRWKNLDRIWDLLGDEKVFKDYIQAGVRDFIAGK